MRPQRRYASAGAGERLRCHCGSGEPQDARITPARNPGRRWAVMGGDGRPWSRRRCHKQTADSGSERGDCAKRKREKRAKGTEGAALLVLQTSSPAANTAMGRARKRPTATQAVRDCKHSLSPVATRNPWLASLKPRDLQWLGPQRALNNHPPPRAAHTQRNTCVLVPFVVMAAACMPGLSAQLSC